MFILHLLRKIKIAAISVITLFSLIGAFAVGHFFLKNDVAMAEAEPIKNYQVKISDEDFKKVQEIEFKSGYKREYNFTYVPKDEKSFAFEDSKNDNFVKSFIHSTDKALRKKSLSFDVRSITMLGYDTKSLNKEDITYNEAKKTLYIKPPQLQMVIMLDYSNTQTDEGFLTSLFDSFSPEEMDLFHDGAREQVQEKFLNETEIELGYDLTNKSYRNEILESKEFSIDIEKVFFEKNDQSVEIINEELETN